jgi:hypothetical protein
MKHEPQLSVLRTQRSSSLCRDKTFISGQVNPKLRLGALTDCNHQVPFKFCCRISLGPALHNIRCHGPATVANLTTHLKLFLPRKLLRNLRYIQRQPVRLLVNQQIRICANNTRTLGHFLSFLYFLCFLNFLYFPLARQLSARHPSCHSRSSVPIPNLAKSPDLSLRLFLPCEPRQEA